MNEYMKWSVGFVVFLIVFGFGCYLWYQWDTAPYREAAERTRQYAESVENQGVEALGQHERDNPVDAAGDSTETTAAKPVAEALQENETTSIEGNTDNNIAADTPKNVRMSPHGFGPYPEVPEGLPIGEFLETDNVQQELIGRVLVKLWNEGDRAIGGGFYDAAQGKVYPYYPNVIYVKYEAEFNEITGEYETVIAQAGSSYDNFDAVQAVASGDTPPGYRLIDMEDSGINPYEYLDLP